MNNGQSRPSTADNQTKLASKIAQRIEQNIIDIGWPAGRLLGNENQLVEQYGASRWIIREALAITEKRGLTEIRRGRGGGIVVSAPAEKVVENMMRNYLLFEDKSGKLLLSERRLIDGIACRLAIENRSEKQVLEANLLLSELMLEEDKWSVHYSTRIYEMILSMTNNGLIKIFGHTFSQLTYALGVCFGSRHFSDNKYSDLNQQLGRLRLKQLRSIIASDLYGAISIGNDVYNIIETMFRDSPGQGETFVLGGGEKKTLELSNKIIETFPSENIKKRVQLCSLQIQLEIIRLDLPSDAFLGSEKDLVDQYGVARNVFREAIRPLQEDNIIYTSGGRSGGVHVGTPSPDTLIHTALLYFRYMAPSSKELLEIVKDISCYGLEQAFNCETKKGALCKVRFLSLISDAIKNSQYENITQEWFLYNIAEMQSSSAIFIFLKILSTVSIKKGLLDNEKKIKLFKDFACAFEGGDVALSRSYLFDLLN